MLYLFWKNRNIKEAIFKFISRIYFDKETDNLNDY